MEIDSDQSRGDNLASFPSQMNTFLFSFYDAITGKWFFDQMEIDQYPPRCPDCLRWPPELLLNLPLQYETEDKPPPPTLYNGFQPTLVDAVACHVSKQTRPFLENPGPI